MSIFTPKVEFTMVSDPSHGWLLVPEAWIFAACLEPASFSNFSYVSADHIYALEEDADAPKFIQSFQTRFNQPCAINEVTVDVSPIRNWPALISARAA